MCFYEMNRTDGLLFNNLYPSRTEENCKILGKYVQKGSVFLMTRAEEHSEYFNHIYIVRVCFLVLLLIRD